MPDLNPPRLAGDEKPTMLALLRFQRESFLRKLDDLDEDGARSSPVASGTSLLWLTRHLAYAEAVWVLRRFAGRPDEVPPNEVPAGDTVAAAVADYRRTTAAVDAVIEASSLEDVAQHDERQPPVDLRWIVGHLLEETARHAGHADIIRELLDGSTGR